MFLEVHLNEMNEAPFFKISFYIWGWIKVLQLLEDLIVMIRNLFLLLLRQGLTSIPFLFVSVTELGEILFTWKEDMKIEGILLYQCHDIFFAFHLSYMPESYTNYVWSSVSWCLHSVYLQRCSLQRVRITRLVHQYNLHSRSYLSTVGSMLNCTFA